MTDILFIHSNAAGKIYQGLASKHAAIEPPIWAGMLANSMRLVGVNVAVLDAEAEQLTYEQTVTRIIDYKPRIVCFVVYGQQPSASTQNMEGATATATLLREFGRDSFIIFVGAHVAALPVKTLEDEPSIDAVCQNEGVYTLRKLVQVSNLGDASALANIEGLTFRDTKTKQIIQNIPSQIVARDRLAIDLPGVAWDLLPPLTNYRTAGWHSWSNKSEKQPFAALYTSLGCPYRCSFCMINIINRTKNSTNITSADSNVFRYWDPEFIINQFDYFAKQGVRNIKIADELFVLNPRHFLRIAELIESRGYDFNIWAYSRVDTCKPEYLEPLARAGIKWLGLGIENPSTAIRKQIHKGGFIDVKITDLIRWVRDAGINIGGNYIFGLPDDTQASMSETLEFSLANKTEMVNYYCAMAYPGSPLHRQASETGQKLPDSYAGYSQHAYETQNLSNSNLKAEEILRFRDAAWTRYNTDPSYLQLLENKFGTHARQNLEDASKISLKRKILGD